MDKPVLDKLLDICIQAVEYVGSANYQDRENAAKQEVYRNFHAALSNRPDLLGFRPKA